MALYSQAILPVPVISVGLRPALHWKPRPECPHYYAKELSEYLYTQYHIHTHTHTLSEMTQMGATKQSKCGFAYIQKCSQQWEALVAVGN